MSRQEVTENIAVVVPSLNGDETLIEVVDGLLEEGYRHVIVVDDGSDQDHKKYFDTLGTREGVTVLTHAVNQGKGRALKDAFSYIADTFPELSGAITVDGDGQHLREDITRCGEALLANPDKVVLGCRDFDQEGVPPRSVAGNKFTRGMFQALFGIHITDTQTGLRAIPQSALKDFASFDGDRFEYETNMLLEMKDRGIDFLEVPITTVYDQQNYSSHYNAVRDSAKVAKVMAGHVAKGTSFRYVISSLLSLLCDNVLFFILSYLFGLDDQLLIQPISTFLSSLLNFHLNKYYVFRKEGDYWKELLGYYLIFIPRTALSVGFTHYGIEALGITSAFTGTVLKVVVDLILFVAVYFIQKMWLFRKK